MVGYYHIHNGDGRGGMKLKRKRIVDWLTWG